MSEATQRPRVALSSCIMHEDPLRPLFKGKALQYTEQKMAQALWRAGALPVPLLDLKDRRALELSLAQAEGLLLQGGADVAPSHYGEELLCPEWGGDPVRDRYELAAIEVALELGKPILGICRGHQLLNVARGGSLFQDTVTQLEGSLLHRDWERYEILEHSVRVRPGSWLAGVYAELAQADAATGELSLLTNTIHHQAVKVVGAGLRAVAWAPDGVIEAIEAISDEAWMVGVQWHPEWLDGSAEGGPERSPGDPVFERFVEVCRARGQRGAL